MQRNIFKLILPFGNIIISHHYAANNATPLKISQTLITNQINNL